MKVELVEVKQQTMPITLHHVHFFNPKNTEMQAWYVKTFGAKPRSGGAFPSADLPGVALNFSPSPDPVVGTQGRALDHIGFEVKNLEAFCKKLEADGIKLAVPVPDGAGARHRHRVLHRSVGHLHRADGGLEQGAVVSGPT